MRDAEADNAQCRAQNAQKRQERQGQERAQIRVELSQHKPGFGPQIQTDDVERIWATLEDFEAIGEGRCFCSNCRNIGLDLCSRALGTYQHFHIAECHDAEGDHLGTGGLTELLGNPFDIWPIQRCKRARAIARREQDAVLGILAVARPIFDDRAHGDFSFVQPERGAQNIHTAEQPDRLASRQHDAVCEAKGRARVACDRPDLQHLGQFFVSAEHLSRTFSPFGPNFPIFPLADARHDPVGPLIAHLYGDGVVRSAHHAGGDARQFRLHPHQIDVTIWRDCLIERRFVEDKTAHQQSDGDGQDGIEKRRAGAPP